MRRILPVLLLTLLGACTDDGGGGGGPGVTSHVLSFDFAATDGGTCVTGQLLDVDTVTPGAQYECSVSHFTAYGAANQQETILPQCNNVASPDGSTNKPCWAIETAAATCAMADHLRITLESAAAPAADTHVTAQCASP